MKKFTFLFLISMFCFSFASEAQENKYISVFETPQIVEINRTLQTSDCNNKYYLAVDLPTGAKGWIYSITTITKSEIADSQRILLDKILGLSKRYEAQQLVDFINHNESKRSFNLYIMQKKEHAESFFNCGYYEYVEKYIETKSRSAIVQNAEGETFYIGIENNADMKNLLLKIEIVAVM